MTRPKENSTKSKTQILNLKKKERKQNRARAKLVEEDEADRYIDTFGAKSSKSGGMLGHHQQQEHAFLLEKGLWDQPLYDHQPLSFSPKRVS